MNIDNNFKIFLFAIENFSYKRYNFFVNLNSCFEYKNNFTYPNNKKLGSFLQELLPFYIKRFEKLSNEEIIFIIEVLKTEINKEKSKKTFMKSFEEVANTDRFELFIKQIQHYYTTYGKDLGIYDGEKVYIDNEDFDKKIIEQIILIELKNYEEFKKRFLEDLYNTLQWTKNELEDIKVILSNTNVLGEINIDNIKSKELKYFIINYFSLIPKNPDEFFKSLLYILTKDSLIINNDKYLDKIEESMNNIENVKKVQELLNEFIKLYGIKKLSNIFNRYKNFFIMLKYFSTNNNIDTRKIINKISKLSKKYHKPKKNPDYLTIADKIEKNILTEEEFIKICNKMDISYLVKLANLLNKRSEIIEQAVFLDVYIVRNGKYWFKEKIYQGNYKKFLYILKSILGKRISDNLLNLLEEENIYIDLKDILNYGIPFSGKKFLGNIPFGTVISDFNLLGVYWKNIKKENENIRIDLDLSLTNPIAKIGWNSVWSNNNIIFSGDMTDAKNGAVESFYIRNNKNIYILNLNWYNYNGYISEINVPYTLFFGNIKGNNIKEKDLPKTTMINNILFSIKDNINNFNPYQQLGVLIENNFIIAKLFKIENNFYSNANLNQENIFKLLKILLTSFIKFEDLKEYIDFSNIERFVEQCEKDNNTKIQKLDKNQITKDILLKIVK